MSPESEEKQENHLIIRLLTIFLFWKWPWSKLISWICEILKGHFYSRRQDNQLLLKSLMNKMSKANDLSTTNTFDKLTDKVSKAREDLPEFTLTLSGVQQYYYQCKNSKTDKELLDSLNGEVKDFLAQQETVRSRKENQFDVAMTVQAIASSNLCVNTEPNGLKPYPVTAFSVEACNGELVFEWKDEKNDGCIRYDIKLCNDLGIDRSYDVQPHIKFCSLNDRAVKNWKTYTVAVRPVNNSGAGPYCDSIECLNATIPSIPSHLEIVNPTSNTSVKLSCLCPQIEDVTACIVKGVMVDDIEVPIVERNGNLATIEVKGLCDANAEFTIQLKFRNKYGESEKYSHPLKVEMSSFNPDDFVLSPKAGNVHNSDPTNEAKLESQTSSTSKESLGFNSFSLMALMKWLLKFPFLVLKLAWSYKIVTYVSYFVLHRLHDGFSENVLYVVVFYVVVFLLFRILTVCCTYIALVMCVLILFRRIIHPYWVVFHVYVKPCIRFCFC